MTLALLMAGLLISWGQETVAHPAVAAQLQVGAVQESEAARAAAAKAAAELDTAEAQREAHQPEAARAAVDACVQALVATEGAERSPAIASTLERAGNLAHGLGALPTAIAARSALVRGRELALDPEHPELLRARRDLARSLRDAGELARARALLTGVVEVLARTRPPDDPELQTARLDLAMTVEPLGELAESRRLAEQVLAVLEGSRPADDRELQLARMTLAIALKKQGEMHAARELFESVLAVLERTLPPDDLDLQDARTNYAIVLRKLGDLFAARDLEMRVLQVLSARLPEEHAGLQVARQNLAITLRELGQLEGARTLQERVLEVRARLHPDDHPWVRTARQNLALTRKLLGDLAGARALEEQVLAVCQSYLPDDHQGLQMARSNLAATEFLQGDLEPARALQEKVLAIRSRLPADHRDLQAAREALAWTLAAAGDEAGARRLTAQLAAGLRAGLARMLESYAPREVEARAIEDLVRTSSVLSLAAGAGRAEADAELVHAGFQLVEMQRGAALTSQRFLRAARSSPGAERERERLRELSERVANLATGGSEDEALAAAVRERDAAERTMLAALQKSDARFQFPPVPDVPALVRAREVGTALIGYWAYTNTRFVEEQGSRTQAQRCLLAHVVSADGKLARIELGPLQPIEEAVDAWRRAALAPVERGAAAASGPEAAAEAGAALRKLVFDPLRPSLGDAQRLILALDDVLHLVPLDALPSAAGALGDEYAVEVRATLWELVTRAAPVGGEPLLLALGDIDYDAEVAGPSRLPEAEAVTAKAVRDGGWDRGFGPLPETGTEVRGIAALFASAFAERGSAVELTRARATKAELVARGPTASYLHLATHGYFAPESIASLGDLRPLDRGLGLAPPSREEEVRGLSPMVLCGLALASANRPRDAGGRIPGIVTAEEMAALDLSRCALVVLSACQTNVGVRRSGQGVASLQKALHMAGARSVVTSLWRVDDEAACELMVDFYRRIWVQGKPKGEALWEAKERLRAMKDERGEPRWSLRDWAGWTLTGESD